MLTACFATAVLAYLAAGALLARGWRQGRGGSRAAGLLFLTAIGATWLWALVGLLASAPLGAAENPPSPVILAGLALTDTLRAGSWLWVAHAVLGLVRTGSVEIVVGRDRPLFWAGSALVAAKLLACLALLAPGGAAQGIGSELDRVAGLGVAVLSLILIENIYKAGDSGGVRWAVKHLLIGLGGLFAFDLFRYADALLLQRFSTVTLAAQPIAATLAAPLLVVAATRIRGLSINIHVARRFVLQTTALVASGVYLLSAAAVGFLVRGLGFAWAPVLQVTFLFGALLLLAVLLSSGQVRTRGRRLVERSFFSFAYDYREEWLRFAATMAGRRDDGEPLYVRAIQAAAEPLDCSAGLLYLPGRDEGAFRYAAHWNWADGVSASPPPGFPDAAADGRAAADLRRLPPAGPENAAGFWPGRPAGSWVLVALHARGRRIGLLLLGRPRVSRELTWEDHDLLGVFAAQIGGYIAEEQTTRALADARRFEQVSKRFSFVAHDLKNIVSQLSLLLQQAERHGDKPEFLRDTLLTVGESVEKMRAMLLRLREGDAAEGGPAMSTDLAALLQDLAERSRRAGRAPALALAVQSAPVGAEPDALATVIGNLLDNAYGAGAEKVSMTLTMCGREAVLEVRDDGRGMTRAFIDEHLFRPFVSTKKAGFGIGMYQSREQVEGWGGSLEVESEPGAGTLVRISLPLASVGQYMGPGGREPPRLPARDAQRQSVAVSPGGATPTALRRAS